MSKDKDITVIVSGGDLAKHLEALKISRDDLADVCDPSSDKDQEKLEEILNLYLQDNISEEDLVELEFFFINVNHFIDYIQLRIAMLFGVKRIMAVPNQLRYLDREGTVELKFSRIF
jgi:hypothetical protein